MELSDLRARIDEVDAGLIRLLERRMDLSAQVAAWKLAHHVPVLDAAREAEKLAAVRAQCRPETADGVAAVFESIMAASRARQEALMEDRHGD